MRRPLTYFGLFALMVLGMGGCVKPIDPAILESPAYSEGYSHGCSTAHERQNGFASPIVRDEVLFETDEAYRIGWKQGFGACGGTSADPRHYNEDQWYSND
ncbi:MAG: hypothetical protein EP347_00855 [Alphaproteobacteria bacterium]|nr:MAG: hypothetical protein EP347_00855 [Alphaproteobacteria bacterium]